MRKLSAGVMMILSGLLTTSFLLAQQTERGNLPKANWSRLPRTEGQPFYEPPAYILSKPGTTAVLNSARAMASRTLTSASASGSTILPLWFYNNISPRDGNGYFGLVIGTDPALGSATTRVPAFIVPVVLQFNSIGVAYNATTGVITTSPGIATFDPTAPDNACLSDPNNVPATLFRQSPLFENAGFNFGGTDVGTTQYVDAFQRASFWKVLGEGNDYHVLLDPLTQLAPVVINVPPAFGTTRPAASTIRRTCGPQGIVDINWLDNYLSTLTLPALTAQGVASGTLPIFQLYNVVGADIPTNTRYCCILGYHGANGPPLQTYSVADFDTSGFFAAGLNDTGVLSHEIGEWANDPIGFNLTPLWGHTGQVGGCQGNLEVGDPLTGSLAPSVVMPNGFTYHLQELMFYSWFLGGPSAGVNGWYSNNASYLRDAGPPCH